MPDMVREKVRERLAKELSEEEIELQEDGTYRYRAKKQVKIFGLFKARARVEAEINSETGELERVRNRWWTFLASDDSETIVGASCGTVSPDSRGECCMNKGYDAYNEASGECILTE